MSEWTDIASAPKDGTVICAKREYKGHIVKEGKAQWREVSFGPLYDPITGECFAKQEVALGWMNADSEHRFPTPTHWKPTPA